MYIQSIELKGYKRFELNSSHFKATYTAAVQFIVGTNGSGKSSLAMLSVAAGLGFEDLGERTAAAALADGLAPGDIEEAVFHASPYAGMARTRAVLAGVHTAMTAAGIALPLESRTVV
jgi:ABC-type hemin transport system ATPase subunit